MKPQSQVFRFGCYALFLGLMTALTWADEAKAPTQADLLHHEQTVMDDAEWDTLIVTEKEKMFLSDYVFEKVEVPFQEPAIAAKPSFWESTFPFFCDQKPQPEIIRPSLHHEYNKGVVFDENPFGEVKLPPLPPELSPFGKHPKKSRSTIAKSEKQSSSTEKEIVEAKPEDKISTNDKETLSVAISPFLAWVREGFEKEAAEAARESQKQYQQAPPKNEGDISNDIFLNIRFPYRGAEPSQSSAAIYSTPSK